MWITFNFKKIKKINFIISIIKEYFFYNNFNILLCYIKTLKKLLQYIF